MRLLRLGAVLLALAGIAGRSAAQQAAIVLDHQALLDRQTWWDNRDWSWYKSHIPFLDSPDAEINATYYYRWELVTKHLTYGSPVTGYTFTEFIDRPSWSGAYGAISCPLGHQMYEIRWLRDPGIQEDFARYWFETPGAQPRSYSNWYGDAVWATYLVTANRQYLQTMLPHMETQYAGWMAEHWDSTRRMFHWDGLHDGMEVNINSRLTDDEQEGADGFRPTLNSYLYADAMAISHAAALFGDSTKSRDYASRAADLKQRVQHELWDPARDFFFHQFRTDEKNGIRANTLTYRSGPFAGNPHGREEIGFVPWQFNLPDAGYERAWRFLMDTAYFLSPFGPTTVERHDPQFRISPRCCVWSGNAWPYATTQTLVAMANLLDNYHQDIVTKGDWFRLFRTYTLDQRKNGRPYIAEAANPDNGSWDGHDTPNHSEHYFHSGYVDLVITGLVGLRPRADDTLEVKPLAPDSWDYFAVDNISYHGHDVAVIWDRDGTRYHRGAGLMVMADGQVIGRAPTLQRLVATLPPQLGRMAESRPHPMNLAVNNGHHSFALIRTSYSAPGTSPHFLNDGNYWYAPSPANRWTTEGSPNRSDWITLDFAVGYDITSLKLYFLDDSIGVRPPLNYDIQVQRNGVWQSLPVQQKSPEQPAGRQANTVTFPAMSARRLRIVVTPQPGNATGLTEIEAWGRDAQGDLFITPACNDNLASCTSISASYTSKYDHVGELNDMVFAFSRYSRNRWTAFGSPNRTDWVEVDFHGPDSLLPHHKDRVEQVELYLWGDGGGVKAPRRYVIQTWNGRKWIDARVLSQVPAMPRVSSVNTVRIAPVVTDRIRVVFVHDLPAVSGMTEIIIRGKRL